MTTADIFLLILFGLLPSICTVGFFYLLTKTKFKEWRKIYKALIIGVVFGGLCILSTEFGPSYQGIPLNTRTAAVVSCSFVFGWPAGLIAAFIGSLERGLSLLWNSSRAFTEIACTVATAVAGIVAGLLRKFMFDDKTPSPLAGMLCALVIEVFHMLLVFLTNMGQLTKALDVVQNVSFPMICTNSVAVFLSLLIDALLLKFHGLESRLFRTNRKKIATSVQINLIFVVLACFTASMIITFFVEDNTTKQTSQSTIITNIDDIEMQINSESDKSILTLSDFIAKEFEESNIAGLNPRTEDIPLEYDPESPINKKCNELANDLKICEINLVNSDGIVYGTNSANKDRCWRFDMKSTEQSLDFEYHLNSYMFYENHYAQRFQPSGSDPKVERKYGGTKFTNVGGYVQAGYDGVQHYSVIKALVEDSTYYRTVGSSGRLMIATNSQLVISDRDGLYKGYYLFESSLFGYDISNNKQDTLLYERLNSKPTYYVFERVEGYYIVGTMTETEVSSALNLTLYITGYISVLSFALLIILAYGFINRVIVKKINRINDELNQITNGNLDVVLDVKSHAEFQTLSDDINKTVDSLKEYIAEANARIDRELEFAKQIQMSSLPAPIDLKATIDLYSMMATAKEVGGDFYDFYYIDRDHMVILIADVSGKGIPAAMFMMKSKTLIKSLMMKGLHTDEAFYEANNELCEENEAEMFVTAWMAVINITNGEVEYCNAGHNAPLLGSQSRHDFHYFRTKSNLVLGGMKGVPYTRGTYKLSDGETIFLYTDGVTEATNSHNELFGEARLLEHLNAADGLTNRMIIKALKGSVDEFQGDNQFDDITMLAFTYLGKTEKYTLNIKSNKQEFEKVYDFVNKTLMGKVEENKRKHLLVSLDEVLANIADYGYQDEPGPINLVITIEEEQVIVTIADASPKFNPLEAQDPDTNLSAEERQIGGLGIFMVKQLMDEVHYLYEFGRNILTLIIKKKG